MPLIWIFVSNYNIKYRCFIRYSNFFPEGIRLCCPYGTIHERLANGEKGCRKHEVATEFENEINVENSNVKALLENHHFGYVDDRPCNKFYLAENYTMTHVIFSTDLERENQVNLVMLNV